MEACCKSGGSIEEALAGHRSGFEIAVKDESFGEVTVGRFVVSFHFRFLAVS